MSSLSAALLCWILTQPSVANLTPDARPRAAAVDHVFQAAAPAQAMPPAAARGREWFVSWGYNGSGYTASDMRIRQPSLGNDFTLAAVRARDSKGWTELFSHGLFVPQYNIRIGYYLNERWGIEVALDHFKWIVRQDQQVRMSGTLNGAPVDTQVTLTADVLRYQLNNGANPVFINLIRRMRIAGTPGRPGHVALMAKTGGGFAVPHTENTLFGRPNDDGFQPFHGWNLDAAAALRVTLVRSLYFEFEEKLLYARYFGVRVDRGTAQHSVKAGQYVWSFGLAFGR